ncbi:polysaccharide biosynthesis tyrosine autokinase [Sanguibacter suaedae]|uniref:non-specific protein-tyrosine kinase n=1 Tax=Sanguibacter suaedae TaxID=2795737 RepID=A0A934ICL1_9MICO|nr:polysaccharide biosynthesis tyrosine autokinase [Sanguibacter suaedae]MBI9116195.1 polysaccharide biosynthesis tyrosine autokinase [Sanguibacter suaedae]
MELHAYLSILRKRWISIVTITLLCLGAAGVISYLSTPMYEARSQVFVSVRTGGTTTDLLQGSSFTQKQVKSYTDLVASPRVLIPVIEHLELPTTPEALARAMTADSPLDTVLINISVSHPDPQLASDIANATAESLATEVTALEKPEDGPSPVQISPVRSATPPTTASSPNLKLNMALGLLIGVAVGVGLAVLREVLDTRVRTEADVKQVTDTSVIATIGYDQDAPDHPLIVQSHPQSQRAESFRRLRTNLQFLDIAGRPHTIVITSSLPGEGKSTTSINLAITLADAGSRVVLVDADLRRPSVAEYMGLEGNVGLTTVLIGRANAEDVVQPWGNGNLHVLPSGQIPPNPSELLGSKAMASLLEELAKTYDIVLLDTAPLLPVTDAAILARLTGGALVVVGSDTLNKQQLGESMGSLETVGARILGVVLNRLERKQGEAYAYYDYSSLEPDDPRRSTSKNRDKTPRRREQHESVQAPSHPEGLGQRKSPSVPNGHLEAPETAALEDLLEDRQPSAAGKWPGRPLDD